MDVFMVRYLDEYRDNSTLIMNEFIEFIELQVVWYMTHLCKNVPSLVSIFFTLFLMLN